MYILLRLYSLYRGYYVEKDAVQHFLKHVQLEKAFIKLPTHKELQLLLVMQSNVSASKYVAKLMHLSPKTTENYKARLRNKLEYISLAKLLSLLRNYERIS